MKMVSIHCSHTVIPSEPTPSSNLSLSHCDQIKLPTHGSQLYLYTNTSITDDSSLNSLIHTLTTSLSKALTLFYPLAGRLSFIHGGRFQLLCNSKGALLIEATSEFPFDQLGPHQKVHLVPTIDYVNVPIENIPLLIAQLTRFPCGSVTLGIAVCRAVLDGSSLGNFMTSWAKLAKGEILDSGFMPFLDRTLLDSRKLNMAPRFEHVEFFPPPLCAQKGETKPVLATATLKLRKVQVEKLKKKASNFGNGSTSKRGYTSFEVITGHLWRCVCKVRYVGNEGHQQTRVTTLVNCRNRLNPPLHKTYFGNATFPTVTQNCSFDDVVNKPLSYAVRKVREAIERMSDEYVRSALDYIADVKDINLLRDVFYNSAGKGGEFRGDPNLYVVGWTNFPFFATDFGWGKPVCMVPGNINSEGKAFLLDTASGDGFLVVICLQAAHVDALEKVFYEGRYIRTYFFQIVISVSCGFGCIFFRLMLQYGLLDLVDDVSVLEYGLFIVTICMFWIETLII